MKKNIIYSDGEIVKERHGNFSDYLLPIAVAEKILAALGKQSCMVLLPADSAKSVATIHQDYKKVLLVSSFGTTTGEPLRMFYPNRGLVKIYDQFLHDDSNVDCLYLDPNMTGKSGLERIIGKIAFDVVGFSVLNTTLGNDLELMSLVRRISPGSKLVIGGQTIRTIPLDLLDHVEISHVIYGNGYLGIKKVLDDYRGVLITVPDTEEKPEIISMEDFFSTQTDDTINGRTYAATSDKTILPYNCAGNNPLRIKISDNCSGQCSYCNVSKAVFVPRGIPEIMAEIEQSIANHDSIEFEDHQFSFHYDCAIALCHELARSYLCGIPKQCCTRTDSVDETLLAKMRSAGIVIVNYGVESFNQKIIDFFRKGVRVRDNIRALDMTLRCGIKPGLNLILFSPLETLHSLRETVNATMHYLSLGATVNIVPKVTVSYGDKALKLPSHSSFVTYKQVFFEGMLTPILLPRNLRLQDPLLEIACAQMISETDDYCFKYLGATKREPSVALRSAAYILSLAKILHYDSHTVRDIEKTMERIVIAEENRVIMAND